MNPGLYVVVVVVVVLVVGCIVLSIPIYTMVPAACHSLP